jgi:predicted AAA+ superfamily ATPase
MIYKVFNLSKIEYPLLPNKIPDIYKVYLFDVGILRIKSGINMFFEYDEDINFKGCIVENFVLQQLKASILETPFYNSVNGSFEVDFIFQYKNNIIPIEVKSSRNAKSRSLKIYTEKYKQLFSIRYSLKNLCYTNNILSIPLYLIQKTKEFIEQTIEENLNTENN